MKSSEIRKAVIKILENNFINFDLECSRFTTKDDYLIKVHNFKEGFNLSLLYNNYFEMYIRNGKVKICTHKEYFEIDKDFYESLQKYISIRDTLQCLLDSIEEV